MPLLPAAPGDLDFDMPSLFRFLAVVAIICGSIYGGLYIMANALEPTPRETSTPVAVKVRR